jgi:hypothetical protein
MRCRLASVLIVVAVLLPAAPTFAQIQNPFDNAPPPQPTPVPTATPVDQTNDNVGRDTLYAIGGVLVVAFVGIGWWIARDARRSLPPELRDSDRRRDQGPHKHELKAKAKARAKGRAQRRARKAGRRARR